jgi:hypothetical protein
MNIHKFVTQQAKKQNKEVYFLYGDLYKKMLNTYPDLVFGQAKSKMADIREQGYEDKFIELLKEEFPEDVEGFEKRTTITKYTNEQKIKIFENELNLIKSDDIKKFVVSALIKVPDYVWGIPASSTMKYHPAFSCEVNGLIKHIKAMVKILHDLFQVETFEFDERKRDILTAGAILHDMAKNGFNGSEYTVPKHPLEITIFLRKNINLEDLPQKDFDKMCSCIESHMGKFNTTGRGKNPKEILPKPKAKMEVVLHLADLLSSRKYITMDFNKDFEV